MLLTWLYVPGDRPDRFAKAVAAGADAVIIDLEDAVAAGRKAYARDAVAEFLADPPLVPVQVRVNELTGPDVDADLAAVAGRPGLAGLRLPKVEHPATVVAVAARVGTLLHPLIESAVGLESAYRIAAAHPAVASLGLGEADLRSDLGVASDDGLLWSRGRIVVAARAAGLPPPAMSVYANVADLAGLAASCVAGRRLGFLGRAAIHPQQLPVIAEAFRPADREVARARELLAAVAEAQHRDSGTVVLPDGRFADRAMVAAARQVVDLAARYAV
ncbi:Citrate lyase subunit beta [Micromonospora sp. MW-13]|uniref:HpcH/HpaI aldolase/citrate lyase family protein n=1 Tax=unclassified Micromonospora TaxID=2617518 RepID=UPI000E4311FB|nr:MULTISPECIES: CoA ester lyase [unclassified Micromonospora]MCX4471445.1 CoA ester lyase [Micromonospora sp. NBC_01655]RGC65043.1 Citrate lyase subunit beta [Micromonospora sp. MW-13]